MTSLDGVLTKASHNFLKKILVVKLHKTFICLHLEAMLYGKVFYYDMGVMCTDNSTVHAFNHGWQYSGSIF